MWTSAARTWKWKKMNQKEWIECYKCFGVDVLVDVLESFIQYKFYSLKTIRDWLAFISFAAGFNID